MKPLCEGLHPLLGKPDESLEVTVCQLLHQVMPVPGDQSSPPYFRKIQEFLLKEYVISSGYKICALEKIFFNSLFVFSTDKSYITIKLLLSDIYLLHCGGRLVNIQ